MNDLNNYTKRQLVEIASWYDIELKMYKPKKYLVNVVSELLGKQEELPLPEEEKVQMSARVRRIKGV